jgi:hypothetical protein
MDTLTSHTHEAQLDLRGNSKCHEWCLPTLSQHNDPASTINITTCHVACTLQHAVQ